MERNFLRRLVSFLAVGVGVCGFRLLILGLAVVITACCSADQAEETAGAGLPGPQDACPVCGMFVAPYPAWVAQVGFEDGTAAFFDGGKDMFKYLLARDRYLPEKRQIQIAAIWVTDYYELEPIEARAAFFVMGSDVLGPMGHELVPLASMAAAEEFKGDHGGTRIVRFEEVTPELVSSLN